MAKGHFTYIIIGGGLAGASAIEGIREVDPSGPILIISKEPHLPYNRPPLSKGLWTGKKRIQDIYVHDGSYYEGLNASLVLDNEIVSLDPSSKSVSDFLGEVYTFDKLLLATGGAPYKLEFNPPAPDGINYFRNIDDYQNLLSQCTENSSATIIGGGFIGVELAAALTRNNVKTTLIFPEPWPCHRIFPAYLGLHILDYYRKQGVTMITEDKPVKVLKNGDLWNVETVRGLHIESNILIAGIGIAPSAELAAKAGLKDR